MRYLLLCVLIICIIGGCASKNVHTYPSTNRVVITSDDGLVICVEPPMPTVVTQNIAASGKIKATDYVSIEGSSSYDETAHETYKLNNENVLLQSALFRLCEMMANIHNIGGTVNPLGDKYEAQFDKIFLSVKQLLDAKVQESNAQELRVKYKMYRLLVDILQRQIKEIKKDPKKTNQLEEKYAQLQKILEAIEKLIQ